MATQPEHLKTILSSWKNGMMSSDDAAAYMKSQAPPLQILATG
ncbi:hypothetical protein F442_03905 [Phytophthora nicotianae P10297]|uniref:Uncharacterized protein n=1 Tax=Phytophthora nicotianae P10297 TaxID=1317064 RepID=W2ZU98_PHYNI|nr:hypothetical protein F442_03905 [Phytophthora nicotianae P10297]